MDKLTLTYEREYPDDDGVSAVTRVTSELNHGSQWMTLVDDFVAFLRGTGYYIDAEWVNHYQHSMEAQKNVDRLFMGKDAMERSVDDDGTVTITFGEPTRKPKAKKKKKKAKR